MLDAADINDHRAAPALRIVSSDSLNHRIIEKGQTFADALRLMARADTVHVAVPHGFGDAWSYFTVTKAEVQRSLASPLVKPDAPLASRLCQVHGVTGLYFGDVYAISKYDDAIRDSVTAEMAR